MNIVKILLISLCCLLGAKDIAAQTDTIQYYMKVDTTRSGIWVGQEVALRYICTVQYDSVVPPRFNAPMEMVKEATPHRSGRAVVNGKLTDIYEFGFEYVVRFQTEGRHNLPLSTVLVKGKEYRTLPVSVRAQPALSNIDGVECSVSIEPKHPKVEERFDVLLVCNRKPDSKRSTVTLNGQQMEWGGHSYSAINEKEVFRFSYPARVANGGRYTLSVSELSFGGTPYHIPDTEIEIAGGRMHRSKSGNTLSTWVLLSVAGTYLLLGYLILWLRFRKEADEELVTFVLRHHRLNLNAEWAYTHYSFSLFLLMIPFVFLCVNLYTYIVEDGTLFFPLFWCGALPLVLAYVSYRNQRKKLNFEPIATTLSIEQVRQAITEVAQQHDWIIDHIDDHCFVPHTCRSFPSLSWGEQIFCCIRQRDGMG